MKDLSFKLDFADMTWDNENMCIPFQITNHSTKLYQIKISEISLGGHQLVNLSNNRIDILPEAKYERSIYCNVDNFVVAMIRALQPIKGYIYVKIYPKDDSDDTYGVIYTQIFTPTDTEDME